MDLELGSIKVEEDVSETSLEYNEKPTLSREFVRRCHVIRKALTKLHRTMKTAERYTVSDRSDSKNESSCARFVSKEERIEGNEVSSCSWQVLSTRSSKEFRKSLRSVNN
ncbi:hypothetical protein NPIL_96981 [Nephila pilipes]|uniref:Uncharacterized protein n=1 Tax=Nephila pilipes TaxID=299642 RepID=A0A8X6Q1L7_NEPPI|nr:hypothetical protein NPIL_96981 [Nephila pilipes]